MASTENKIFMVIGVLVLAAALLVYVMEYLGEDEVTIVSIATTKTTKLGTTTTAPTTTKLGTTTLLPTTIPSPLVTTIIQPTTIPTTTTTTSSTTTTLPEVKDYLSKYRGQGYRQAYMNITFLCPSCVPAVAANLRNEHGVIVKSMSYKQRVTWIIYDPTRVKLERIYQLATANGEGILLNDTEI